MPIQSQETTSTIKGVWQITGVGTNRPCFIDQTYRIGKTPLASSAADLWFVYVGPDFDQARKIGLLAATVCASSSSDAIKKNHPDYVNILARSFREAFNLQATPCLPEPLRSAEHVWGFSAATPEIA